MEGVCGGGGGGEWKPLRSRGHYIGFINCVTWGCMSHAYDDCMHVSFWGLSIAVIGIVW